MTLLLHQKLNIQVTQPKKLLVVDDNLEIRLFLSTILTQSGYQVYTSSGGFEAMQFLEYTPVDLVITDVQMPDGNGLWLLQALKSQSGKFGELPVFLITAGEDPEKSYCLSLGAEAFFKKPLDLELLEKEIEKTLSDD